MDKIKVGNFLADLRNEKGLTQEQLAEILNVNYKTISKWECGNSLPNLETFAQLSEIYDISLYELANCEKINNPLISKNNIKKIVNQESIKKFLIRKTILLIISIILVIFTTFTYIYTINNYNQIKVYELVGEDSNIEIEGLYVETHKHYYLSISNIKCLEENEKFIDEKIKYLQYEIISDTNVKETKNMTFENETQLKKALSLINIYVSSKKLIPDIDNLYLRITFENSKNKTIVKTIKIKPSHKQDNNKLFY